MHSTVWCVGKNYLLHAQELNQPVEREPLIFIKSYSCIVQSHVPITLPRFSQHIDYEVELAFLFDAQLSLSHVSVALDLTARDTQTACKAKGLPWTLAKSFKQSLPLGKWIPYHKQDPLNFSLYVNDRERQKGSCHDMLFSLNQIREFLLERFPIAEGDILLTGTPAGISKVESQDRACVYLNQEKMGEWLIL